MKNLFVDLPRSLPEELVDTLIDTGNVRIERIVSTGHCSAEGFWYDQEEDEWVVVLTGHAWLEYEGGERCELKVGDHRWIPAGKRHRVLSTSEQEPTVWLAVFAPPAESET